MNAVSPLLWIPANSAWTQVNLELSKDSRHNECQQHCRPPEATGTLACLQVIHMGVACRNAQLGTNEEEDDLEHTGILTSPMCAPTCTSDWSWCPSPWGPRGLLLRGYIRCSSYKVLMQRTTSGPALGVMGDYRPLVWEDVTSCSSQHGGWHESCQWQGTAFCLVTFQCGSGATLTPSRMVMLLRHWAL